MTKYREILRLQSLGFSERNIAQSCGVSRNTVARVLKKAAEINISWPLDFDMTDSALEELMFPKDKSVTNKRMPDFDYIRKELLRNGVNKKLLWVEYCEECRMSSEEPLMYSQFCYYIQKDEENVGLPCISQENQVNRLKLTGPVTLPTSLIRTPEKSQMHGYL